ncbi:hypothetical protein MPLA_870019 [Mesorhizobium sp. ORS 3359]|nr:hypothetical protein MPLA_870019 [Mesorhizobium sp. ORS 3359]
MIAEHHLFAVQIRKSYLNEARLCVDQASLSLPEKSKPSCALGGEPWTGGEVRNHRSRYPGSAALRQYRYAP